MDAELDALGRLVPVVGANALPIYFSALASLLGLTWLGWWAFQRWLLPRDQGTAPTPMLLILRMALGFGAIVLGAWVFAEIAEAMHAEAALGAADQALADAFRTGVPPGALLAFAWLTRLADTVTLTALGIGVAVALVSAGRRWLALGWLAAVCGNALLNTTLKQVFERVRPVHDDGIVLAHGFSFPSGHSSGSVVVYGMLAYIAMRFVPARWHLPVILAAVALAFSIGVSRMFLRVHFASDVIAGFASGTAWLAVCIASIELTRWYVRRRADAKGVRSGTLSSLRPRGRPQDHVPGYQLKTETLDVGGQSTQVRSLLDRQQFADPLGAALALGISSASWPLFGLVWPSGLVLAAHMQRVPLGRRRVLEIGCGLALASLVVHRRSGLITASDHHPLTETFLLENLRLNAMAPLRYRHGDWAATDPLLGRFDLIVGSDVLYDRSQPERLCAFIELHAEARVEVVIVDPDRGNRAAFNRGMHGLGFVRSEHAVRALPGSGLPYKGRLLSYLRAG